jgi:hypothetical protein
MDARLTMDPVDSGFPFAALHLANVPQREERLPFTVRAASTIEQLGKAVAIRHSAYGRHVPALAEQLRLPEAQDLARGCTVLLAESKLDGEALGTLRVQTNDFEPLAVESSVTLPRSLAGARLAEATRLGVSLGRVGHLVRTALFKAFYLYCVQARVDWMVITARSPLERMYQALQFGEVFPGEAPRPIKHVGNIPHRVLKFEVETAEERWRAASHPLYDFVFSTRHPDIDLSAAEEAIRVNRREMQPAALAA